MSFVTDSLVATKLSTLGCYLVRLPLLDPAIAGEAGSGGAAFLVWLSDQIGGAAGAR